MALAPQVSELSKSIARDIKVFYESALNFLVDSSEAIEDNIFKMVVKSKPPTRPNMNLSFLAHGRFLKYFYAKLSPEYREIYRTCRIIIIDEMGKKWQFGREEDCAVVTNQVRTLSEKLKIYYLKMQFKVNSCGPTGNNEIKLVLEKGNDLAIEKEMHFAFCADFASRATEQKKKVLADCKICILGDSKIPMEITLHSYHREWLRVSASK
ncbi:DgyrCDS2801 [Dimorphilus gyrociliatus]|uniref:DgyrCDS2801 n=1 Tax=Dimorphilus gyrociliatus TaxID=2664684 RepID=A0A7I8VGG4_9ANNE|nr:DgyrCDS2801 [Dimorphilus gyrociliatus]